MVSRLGRPRSEDSRQRVLAAARHILREEGVNAVSMDAIASRARVSKQTLYRWWGSKSMILVDAVLDGYEPPVPSTVERSDDRDADIDAWIDRSIVSLNDRETAEAVRALLGAIASDPEAGHRYHRQTLSPARTAVAQMLAASPDAAADALSVADVAISALMFWVLVGEHIGEHQRDALRLMLRSASPPRHAS